MDGTPDERRRLLRMALSIGVSTTPFGAAFGVACVQAGLAWWEAMGFSLLVFGGSAQFAAVSVLGQGGAITAAVAAGGLLTLRSLAFGLLLAPYLGGSVRFRALASQLMIDESTAVAVSTDDPDLRRFGYLAGGISVFVLWNLSTLAGALLLARSGTAITDWGLDATIPAAFLALLWPRLGERRHVRAALGGIVVATLLVPIAPPGLPIVAAALGAMAGLGRETKP